MSDQPNPYQSPASVDECESWWTKLRRLFRGVSASPTGPATRWPSFANGDAIICDGIAFFIDPENPSVAYAASPSATNTERRMNLIVAEVIRVLPFFLADYPEWASHLRGRQLVVRMIANYADKHTELRPEVALNWDILDAVLSEDPSDSDADPTT